MLSSALLFYHKALCQANMKILCEKIFNGITTNMELNVYKL